MYRISEPFYIEKATFVLIPFDARGKTWAKGSEFKWKELNVGQRKVEMLYKQGFLKHDEGKAADIAVGDGLDILDINGLQGIVSSINAVVKADPRITTDRKFIDNKCKSSKILIKQIAYIRNWRHHYGKKFPKAMEIQA